MWGRATNSGFLESEYVGDQLIFLSEPGRRARSFFVNLSRKPVSLTFCSVEFQRYYEGQLLSLPAKSAVEEIFFGAISDPHNEKN